MSTAGLAVRQVGYTNKAFWRNPAAAFFTFAFPIMFLIIFTTLFGNDQVQVLPHVYVHQSTFYVAAMSAFAVISACYTNIAIQVTFQRDNGILKRIRGTPLPGASYLAGRVMHAVLIGFILVAINVAYGAIFYSATITARTLPAFLVSILVGAASFAALGLAITTIIPNADAAPAIVNASILPILFLSDIFIPVTSSAPGWVDFVGRVFPVRHFAEAMQAAFFSPTGSGFRWGDLAVVAGWGLFGLLVAVRRFTWEPRR
ncbi:MAG: ABC transporter permease [Actinomycetota bacterium]